jgi:ABC-2 type transport system permease protein
VTYPFRALVRPLAAHTPAEWLVAIGPAMVLLVLHYVWVVRSDTAFEEAAAEVSLRRAQALSGGRRAGDPQPRRASRMTPPIIRLSPNGWPAGAILWKNLVAGTRIKRIRNAALILGAAGLIVGALSFDPDGTLGEIAGWLAVFWAALMVVTGPQYVRNDLRGDLLKLDLLRSYPLRGWSVVLAEAGASTLMLTMIQFSLLTIGYLAFLGNQTMVPPLMERTLLLLGSFAVLPAINLLSMLIQNGAALLYPAWVRLGSGRPGGVEVLGQNMLMMIAFVAVLAGTLVVPVIVGGGAFLLFRATLEIWAIIPAALVGLGLIGFEAALIVDWLGRIFERTDPASAGIVV